MGKPEALRLAEYLEQDPCSKAHHDEAAAELRRLHTEVISLRAALAQQAEPVQEPDLSRCPQCNGPADNGYDRSIPPNPYLCTKCMAEPAQEPVACPCGDRRVDQCPGKWEPGCDLGGNQRYAMRAVQQPQTLDAAMQQPRAMAQAYESGYKAGQAHERKRIIQFLGEMQRQVGDGHNYYGVAAMRIREVKE